MLLVDDDQPEVAQRREDRRARADAHARLAAAQPLPLVVALAQPELRVQHRDASPKRSSKRRAVCGVSAISGTSTIAERPGSSAAAAARR